MDVAGLAGHLIEPDSVYVFLATHRERLFADERFEDLFPSRRVRPSVPAPVAATVMVVQSLEGLSDREAMEPVAFLLGAAADPVAGSLAATAQLPAGTHFSIPLVFSDWAAHGTFCGFSHEVLDQLSERDLAVERLLAGLVAGYVERSETFTESVRTSPSARRTCGEEHGTRRVGGSLVRSCRRDGGGGLLRRSGRNLRRRGGRRWRWRPPRGHALVRIVCGR